MAEVKWQARRISDGVLVDVTGDTSGTPESAPTQNALEAKDFYAQDADPGAVGSGSIWKDTSAANKKWWTRNATNTGWDAGLDVYAEGVNDESIVTRMRAYSNGTGAANAINEANSAGTGGAAAGGIAAANGNGNASDTNRAQTEGSGNAVFRGEAIANGSGTATNYVQSVTNTGASEASLSAYRGADEVSIYVKVTAAGLKQTIFNGLPTSNPVVAGQLWIDVAAGRVLKVSAG